MRGLRGGGGSRSRALAGAGSGQGPQGPRTPASPSFPPSARGQRLLSGPWVPGGGLSGQALAVAPDGKLLFSGGHWDGSLCVTALPRGKLLSQIHRHLGTSARRLGRGGGGGVPGEA